MNIYLASRGLQEHEGSNYYNRMVIIARDVNQAKRFASDEAFDEGPMAWINDAAYSKIGTAFDKAKPGVICVADM